MLWGITPQVFLIPCVTLRRSLLDWLNLSRSRAASPQLETNGQEWPPPPNHTRGLGFLVNSETRGFQLVLSRERRARRAARPHETPSRRLMSYMWMRIVRAGAAALPRTREWRAVETSRMLELGVSMLITCLQSSGRHVLDCVQ